MDIRRDGLTGGGAVRLLREHLDDMRRITPPESAHALDPDGLRGPDITVWSAWEDDVLLGCGALRALGGPSGEIKAMRTEEAHRGRGVGSAILEHIIAVARERGYRCLYLETGSMHEFSAARELYQRYGFERRGPFGDYVEDPNSVFMAREL